MKTALTNNLMMNYEAPVQAYVALARAGLECGERMAAFNLRQTKAMMDDSSKVIRGLLSAEDPQAFVALTVRSAQPQIDNALDHYHELTAIASSMQESLAKALGSTMPTPWVK